MVYEVYLNTGPIKYFYMKLNKINAEDFLNYKIKRLN